MLDNDPRPIRVAIGGLGSIGLAVARHVVENPLLFELIAVSCSNLERASRKVEQLDAAPRLVASETLAELAELLVEAAPASVFDRIAVPAIEHGRTLIVASAGALLQRPALIERAAETSARIIVASGAISGLDAVRAAALAPIRRIRLETRKQPCSLLGAPHMRRIKVDLETLTEPYCVFRGNAREAAAGFPANANVAASLALAGIGAERTEVEIWADPSIDRNIHIIRVDGDAAQLTLRSESMPSADNPKTGRLAALSVIACLESINAVIRVGS